MGVMRTSGMEVFGGRRRRHPAGSCSPVGHQAAVSGRGCSRGKGGRGCYRDGEGGG